VKARLLKGLGYALLIGLAVALAGPRPYLDDTVELPPGTVPGDILSLADWLEGRENEAGAVVPNFRKRVRFHDPEHPSRTPWSVVHLHGFSANRHETWPLSDRLADALGANLFETRLAGHGRYDDALSTVSAEAWLVDVEEAIAIGRVLGDRVLVLGSAMGGTLATWFVQHHDDSGLALVLLSPNYGPRDDRSRFLTWPWSSQLLRLVMPRYRWEPLNDTQASYWTLAFDSRALIEMMNLVEHVRKTGTRRLDTPVLMMYSYDNRLLDGRIMSQLFETWGGSNKRKVLFAQTRDPAQHILAGDVFSPETTMEVVSRIQRFVSKLPDGASPMLPDSVDLPAAETGLLPALRETESRRE
jgi:alpha-beta hydrolase superfamily lysophospholipase